MFTGIIKNIGQIKEINNQDSFISITIPSLKINVGDSVSIDGACLTVFQHAKNNYSFQISHETVSKTIINNYSENDFVNVELPSTPDTLLSGHIVLGHIDDTAICTDVVSVDENLWDFYFTHTETNLIVNKGSVSINGVSLTTNKVDNSTFYISVIKHTYYETTFKYINVGDKVNIEYDIIGKYINEQT